MNIRTSQFCALSHEKAFHDWLLKREKDLHRDLMNHLAKNETCSKNRDKMIQIEKALFKKGLRDDLVEFLKLVFPHVLQDVKRVHKQISSNATKKLFRPLPDFVMFKTYNPNRLTFPHRMVLYNKDYKVLRRDALRFCRDKVGCDYIIVGHFAYIEYFHQRYKEEMEKVPDKMREIVMYRRRKGININSKNI